MSSHQLACQGIQAELCKRTMLRSSCMAICHMHLLHTCRRLAPQGVHRTSFKTGRLPVVVCSSDISTCSPFKGAVVLSQLLLHVQCCVLVSGQISLIAGAGSSLAEPFCSTLAESVNDSMQEHHVVVLRTKRLGSCFSQAAHQRFSRAADILRSLSATGVL